MGQGFTRIHLVAAQTGGQIEADLAQIGVYQYDDTFRGAGASLFFGVGFRILDTFVVSGYCDPV